MEDSLVFSAIPNGMWSIFGTTVDGESPKPSLLQEAEKVLQNLQKAPQTMRPVEMERWKTMKLMSHRLRNCDIEQDSWLFLVGR